jgi:hypothetical protein
MLATALNVDDHFVVIVAKDNVEDANFWILICEGTLTMVEEVNKIDHWGQEVYKEEQSVIGNITKNKDVTCNPISYASFIYSHLIIFAKFNMVIA